MKARRAMVAGVESVSESQHDSYFTDDMSLYKKSRKLATERWTLKTQQGCVMSVRDE